MNPPEPNRYLAYLHADKDSRLLVKGGMTPIPEGEAARLDRRFETWCVVACRGEAHVVAFSRRGRVALLSHTRDEVRRWRGLSELGGEGDLRPHCLKWLGVLDVRAADFQPWSLPPALDRLRKQANLRNIMRYIRRGGTRD